jgi:hypothetical protein
MYDIIGDVHGHADALEKLLNKLGYQKVDDIYSHENRKVIFLGDFIDRGPKVRETLAIVKAMMDAGNAFAVMGNPEFNFLCYNRKLEDGKYLRPHTSDNNHQVHATLEAFEGRKAELNKYLDWFLTLPLFLELENLRVVHACWKPDVIHELKDELKNNRLNEGLLRKAGTKGAKLYDLVETTLKGLEVPAQKPFKDTDGKTRNEARIKWWLNPEKLTQRDYFFRSNSTEPLTSELQKIWFYPKAEKPVFIGHYWKTGKIELESKNVCCVDYSIAKGGKLVAFRFNDNTDLSSDSFVWVDSDL